MRWVIGTFLFCIIGLPASLAAEKNIVLVVADDLGLDLACYGNRAIQMPNLDALAQDGTVFTHAFCTTASCSASRSVILSGMHNHANGMYGHAHAEHHFSSFEKLPTLSVQLSANGYRTATIGKFHVAPPEVYPFDVTLPGNSRNGVQMANNCRKFITADDERPFFLYFCTSDPHRGAADGPGPHRPNRFGNEGKHPGVKEQPYRTEDVIVPPFLPDTPAVRAELAEYYQASSRVDQGVGRLIEVLKETGHWDDTLFLFCSDNGIAFAGAKTTLYEPGMRLPLIVRNPYLSERGLRCSAMITWVDLAPTILDFVGATEIGTMQGRSFLGVLDQPQPAGWDEIYASHTFHEVTMYYPMRVVRTRRYKLIWNLAHELTYPSASDLYAASTWQEALAKGPDSMYGTRTVGAYLHRPEFELYDLEQDPDEAKNLADDPAHAARLAELKDKLKVFQQRTKDPWVLKWSYE